MATLLTVVRMDSHLFVSKKKRTMRKQLFISVIVGLGYIDLVI